MYTFLYTINLYYDRTEGQESGLIYAETYSNAVAQLEKYYGDELVSISYLEAFDTSLFTFDPKHLPLIKSTIEEDLY